MNRSGRYVRKNGLRDSGYASVKMISNEAGDVE